MGDATSRSYIKRRSDTRNSVDTLYRARYVLPKDGGAARAPSDGFIIQESNTAIGSTNTEIETYFGSGSLANDTQQRNFSFIADATWDGSAVSVATELPHHLSVGSEVELVNITSTENTAGTAKAGYNRTYTVTGISSSKQFSVGLTTDPGTFTNNTSTRNVSLPYYKRKRYDNTYYVYSSEESQKWVSGEQDGVYYLTLLNASNKPTVSPFGEESFSQPIKELYPQTDRDTPNADPDETRCFVESDLIGDVVVNNVKNSITKETLTKYNRDQTIGVGITEITSVAGTAHTITTNIDHGLNRVTKLTITDGGAGYGGGSAGDLYNAKLVSIGSSVTGSNATAKLTVDSSGTITAVKVMDGGSAYGIGNTLAVAVGVGTTTGYSQAVLTVDKIYDNVGDSIRITGVGSESYAGYNTLYRITDVPIGAGNSVTVATSSTISGFTTGTEFRGTDIGSVGNAGAFTEFVLTDTAPDSTRTLSYGSYPTTGNFISVSDGSGSQGTYGYGATADVTVTSGSVSAFTLDNQGFGYKVTDVITVDPSTIGGTGSGLEYTIQSNDTIICSVTNISINGGPYLTTDVLTVASSFDGVGSGSGFQYSLTKVGFVNSVSITAAGFGFAASETLQVTNAPTTTGNTFGFSVNTVSSITPIEIQYDGGITSQNWSIDKDGNTNLGATSSLTAGSVASGGITNSGAITTASITASGNANVAGSLTVAGTLTASGSSVLNDANVSLSNGTAAAPSLKLLNSNTTGLYREGADNLGITAGGTARVKIGTADIETTNNIKVDSAFGASTPFLSVDSTNETVSIGAPETGLKINNNASIESIGSNVNVDITVSPKGTGNLILTGGTDQDFSITDGSTETFRVDTDSLSLIHISEPTRPY